WEKVRMKLKSWGEEIACNLVAACRLPVGRPLFDDSIPFADTWNRTGGHARFLCVERLAIKRNL
ncbi:MAG: hypothetical protein IJV73_00940, partial [Clostridia bacterium]|nr:hypothetical protein [Clostridia bacterium]